MNKLGNIKYDKESHQITGVKITKDNVKCINSYVFYIGELESVLSDEDYQVVKRQMFGKTHGYALVNERGVGVGFSQTLLRDNIFRDERNNSYRIKKDILGVIQARFISKFEENIDEIGNLFVFTRFPTIEYRGVDTVFYDEVTQVSINTCKSDRPISKTRRNEGIPWKKYFEEGHHLH